MMKLDFSKVRITVIGDIMLDKYYIGKVNRISPEAPVPVIKVETSKFTPGGAANVSNNIAYLKANSLLIGATGKDNNESIIVNLLNKINVKTFFINNNLPTITKIRVIGEHQQIARLDFEETFKLDGKLLKKVINFINKIIDKTDVFVISDYGKGFCTDYLCKYIINISEEKNKFVIVDPKGNNWNKYSNSSMITPNIKELSEVVGCHVKNEDDDIEKYGFDVIRKFNLKNLLVTRSEKGMSLISQNKIFHIPTEAKEVYDVSGAGDTVVATLAVGIAAGYNLETAINLANRAAGIVVGKFGTAPITYEELVNSFHNIDKKIVNIKELKKLIVYLKNKTLKIVVIAGSFNIIDKKCVKTLKKYKKEVDILIVAVIINGNTSDKISEVISEFECVDYIVKLKEFNLEYIKNKFDKKFYFLY